MTLAGGSVTLPHLQNSINEIVLALGGLGGLRRTDVHRQLIFHPAHE